MPSIEWNRRMWNDPSNWKGRGDEWRFHAWRSGRPYRDWKRSVAECFINPYVSPQLDVVELGPGHGRWTEFFVGRVRSLTLVDLNDLCIEACRERFAATDQVVTYIVNDGRSLPVPDQSADLIWSFATLVHVDASDIDSYMAEFSRVLRPGGRFIVHHSGWLDWNFGLLTQLAPALASRISTGQWRGRYDRSALSRGRFSTMAARHGLAVECSVRSWGEGGQFRLAAGDTISMGVSTR